MLFSMLIAPHGPPSAWTLRTSGVAFDVDRCGCGNEDALGTSRWMVTFGNSCPIWSRTTRSSIPFSTMKSITDELAAPFWTQTMRLLTAFAWASTDRVICKSFSVILSICYQWRKFTEGRVTMKTPVSDGAGNCLTLGMHVLPNKLWRCYQHENEYYFHSCKTSSTHRIHGYYWKICFDEEIEKLIEG